MKNEKKNYMDFLMIKIWQILKRFTRSFHQAQISYFWRVDWYITYRTCFIKIQISGWKHGNTESQRIEKYNRFNSNIFQEFGQQMKEFFKWSSMINYFFIIIRFVFFLWCHFFKMCSNEQILVYLSGNTLKNEKKIAQFVTNFSAFDKPNSNMIIFYSAYNVWVFICYYIEWLWGR